MIVLADSGPIIHLSKIDQLDLRASLGPGESAALALAAAKKAQLVLLDDREARSAAETMGLATKGTIGVLIEAKQRGMVPAVAPYIHKLKEEGVWFSPQLIRDVLARLGETP